MTVSASDGINYALRPNKTVERKLVFETLVGLSPILDFGQYRYIGFGSIWFVDFIMAHKQLSISDMISIETEPYTFSRACFNRPYSCVRVEHGDSQIVLPSLPLSEKKIVAWLDYNASINGSVLEDLSTLCRFVMTGSVLIVTINAEKNSLADKDGDGREFASDEERLLYNFGNYSSVIPRPLPTNALQRSQYSRFVARTIFDLIGRQVRRAGRTNDEVVPLFNIAYSDNASMLTVGAGIFDTADVSPIESTLRAGGADTMDADNQLTIRVPALTLKEKASLDQLMPCDVAPTEGALVSRIGFRLKPSHIAAYHRFYRYYPTFGEVAI